MFNIKRKDDDNIQLSVYAVREQSENIPKEFKLQFLVFYRDEWKWILAQDWIPINNIK